MSEHICHSERSEESTNTPRLRFAGFSDDWEQRKLGEIGTAKSGIGFPDAEQENVP